VIRAFQAELFKLRTTPGLFVVLAVTLVLTALGIITSFFVGHAGHTHFTAPTSVSDLRDLVGAGYEPGVLLAPVLGVLCITTEYRQKVLTITLLVTPRREQVLVAKVLASVVWSLFLGVAALVLVAAMGIPLFVSQGGTLSTLLHQVGPVVPGLLGAYALLAVFGMGIGTLLRNQVAAVIFTIALTLVLEPILVLLVHEIFHADLNWFPSRSTSALAGGLTRGTGGGGGGDGPLLSWWLGGLALLAWGIGTATLGYFTTFRRDVT
jgi:ABC-type transport system involved in multi-copper enzyme maturation permease subunit